MEIDLCYFLTALDYLLNFLSFVSTVKRTITVRSLGSVALRLGESMHHNFHFNFFAVDYNEVIYERAQLLLISLLCGMTVLFHSVV